MVRLLILAFLMIAALHAAPTAAWKVSLETLASDHKTNEKIRKLDKPPGESAFFQPGDELWDVSSLLKDESLVHYGYLEGPYEDEEKPRGPWKGEWAVWNARSSRLVARGSFKDLIKAQLAWDFKQEPAKLRARFEWFRPGAKEPFHSISVLCRSEEPFEKTDGDFSIKIDPTIGFYNSGIYTTIVASWEAQGDQDHWEAITSLELKDGKRTLVAKHGSGETGWELYVTCQEEGINADEPCLVETKRHGVQPWRRSFREIPGPSTIPLSDGFSIAWYDVPPPFTSAPIPLQEYDLKEIPEPLRKWVDGPLVNCSEMLRGQGIDVDAEGFFAGGDPLVGQLAVAANDKTQAAIAKLIDESLPGEEVPLFLESNPASGDNGLTLANGHKALISKLKGEETETIFQVEATRIPNGIDLKLEMKVLTDGKEHGSLETHTELIPGQWQKVMEAKSGEETEVLIRAGNPPP